MIRWFEQQQVSGMSYQRHCALHWTVPRWSRPGRTWTPGWLPVQTSGNVRLVEGEADIATNHFTCLMCMVKGPVLHLQRQVVRFSKFKLVCSLDLCRAEVGSCPGFVWSSCPRRISGRRETGHDKCSCVFQFGGKLRWTKKWRQRSRLELGDRPPRKPRPHTQPQTALCLNVATACNMYSPSRRHPCKKEKEAR